MKTMLIFDEGTLNSIYRKFTNGRPGEGIKYKEFCEFVMGSKAGDFTSMTDSKVGNFQGLSVRSQPAYVARYFLGFAEALLTACL